MQEYKASQTRYTPVCCDMGSIPRGTAVLPPKKPQWGFHGLQTELFRDILKFIAVRVRGIQDAPFNTPPPKIEGMGGEPHRGPNAQAPRAPPL